MKCGWLCLTCGFTRYTVIYTWTLFFSLPTGYLFYEFDKFWYKERPKTIMEFSHIKDKFQRRIVSQLKKPGVKLFIETDDWSR